MMNLDDFLASLRADINSTDTSVVRANELLNLARATAQKYDLAVNLPSAVGPGASRQQIPATVQQAPSQPSPPSPAVEPEPQPEVEEKLPQPEPKVESKEPYQTKEQSTPAPTTQPKVTPQKAPEPQPKKEAKPQVEEESKETQDHHIRVPVIHDWFVKIRFSGSTEAHETKKIRLESQGIYDPERGAVDPDSLPSWEKNAREVIARIKQEILAYGAKYKISGSPESRVLEVELHRSEPIQQVIDQPSPATAPAVGAQKTSSSLERLGELTNVARRQLGLMPVAFFPATVESGLSSFQLDFNHQPAESEVIESLFERLVGQGDPFGLLGVGPVLRKVHLSMAKMDNSENTGVYSCQILFAVLSS